MTRDELRKYAEENNVPIMMDDGIAFLVSFVRDNPIKDILELGTAIGYSSMQMASIREDIHVDTLEIDPNMAAQARINIAEAGLSERITVHETDAMVYETGRMYDLIFVDAAKAQYGRYMAHFEKNLKVGGCVGFDNLNFHGMVDDHSLTHNRNTLGMVKKLGAFRDALLENDDYEVTFFRETGDGVAIAKKK